MPKKIILTGGGSAGHVTPNLALIPTLQNDGYELSYIGTKNGIERRIIEDAGIKFHPISAGKLRRYFSLKNFIDPFKLTKGYFQARRIINREKPDIVFSKGGFVTVPVVFAASHLKVPIVLHESDYTSGLANRLCIPRASKVCVCFEATSKSISGGKCIVTGAPVRTELLNGNKEAGLKFLGFGQQKPLLLIMGGSLGAQAVNEAVDRDIDKLLDMFCIAHIRGEKKLSGTQKEGYREFEYISEQLPDIFAATDYMLSRSGANAIFEILALNIPALLVPLPLEASRGDQIQNAEYFREKGFSLVLPQSELSHLVESLQELVQKGDELKNSMHNSGISNGAQNVINVLYSILEDEHE